METVDDDTWKTSAVKNWLEEEEEVIFFKKRINTELLSWPSRSICAQCYFSCFMGDGPGSPRSCKIGCFSCRFKTVHKQICFSRTCTCTHTHRHTDTHVHTHTHVPTHMHTHAHTHACMHTGTHAHTHTCTHVRAHDISCSSISIL